MSQGRADEARRIATGLASLDGAPLPVLHEVNDGLGWVSDEDVAVVADVPTSPAPRSTACSPSTRLPPLPAPTHRVARAAARHARPWGRSRSTPHAVAALAGRPDVELGEVFCLGTCALGPSALVDGRLRGRLTPDALVAAVDEAPAAATALQPSATGQGEPVTVYIPADASARAVGADAVAAAFGRPLSHRGAHRVPRDAVAGAARRGSDRGRAARLRQCRRVGRPSILAGTAESVGVLDADPWLAGQRRVTFARSGSSTR